MEVSQLWVRKNLDEELRLHQDALEVVEVFVVLDSALHEGRDRACADARLLREHVVGHRVDLLHVNLNVLGHVFRVEVVREVGRPGRSGLAHVDERPLVGQASLRKRRPRTSS